jgi:hypothetical protein
MLDTHRQKAQQIHARFQQERAHIAKDANLSDQGKRAQLA